MDCLECWGTQDFSIGKCNYLLCILKRLMVFCGTAGLVTLISLATSFPATLKKTKTYKADGLSALPL